MYAINGDIPRVLHRKEPEPAHTDTRSCSRVLPHIVPLLLRCGQEGRSCLVSASEQKEKHEKRNSSLICGEFLLKFRDKHTKISERA